MVGGLCQFAPGGGLGYHNGGREVAQLFRRDTVRVRYVDHDLALPTLSGLRDVACVRFVLYVFLWVHVIGCKVCIPGSDALKHCRYLVNATLCHCTISSPQLVKTREQGS